MRVSCDIYDPGYTQDTTDITVFLDGEEVKSCITADSIKGEVIRHVTDEYGYPTHDGLDVLTETLKGKVTIVAGSL